MVKKHFKVFQLRTFFRKNLLILGKIEIIDLKGKLITIEQILKK